MKKYFQREGFTLIELLVVTAIIALITLILTLVYLSGGRELELKQASNLVAQNLRRALEMTMAAEEIGPEGAEIISPGGYGLYLKKTGSSDEIFLFADCNNNHLYTPGNDVCGTPPNQFAEKIEEVILEKGVVIANLSPSNPLHISFQPPDPIVYINAVEATGQAQIILSLALEASKTKTITLNKTGLIDTD